MGKLNSDHLGSSQVAAALVYAEISCIAWRGCQLSNGGDFLGQQCRSYGCCTYFTQNRAF